MSKHHVHTQCQIMHDIQGMLPTELEQEYGIEIDIDDGSVWDPCEMKQFDSLNHWAMYMQEQVEEDVALASSSSKPNSKRRYDDDY